MTRTAETEPLSFRRSRPDNRVLAILSNDDFALLAPSLKEVVLKPGQLVEVPNRAIEHVYFVTDGQISVIATSLHGNERLEVGRIGPEGMTGLSVVMGVGWAANQAMVQSEGTAVRLLSSELRTAIENSPSLHATLLRYAHTSFSQASQSALANGRGRIDQRIARWLLMWQDRSRSPKLAVTHEFLSVLMGVRRQTVTTTLHELEGDALIRSRRKRVEVLDREGLERVAGGFYGAAEADYERLLAPSPISP